jgi:hypothetical protein
VAVPHSSFVAFRIDLSGAPTDEQRAMLARYLEYLPRGERAVCDMILADLRFLSDQGAWARAADVLAVLRRFLFEHPEAATANLGPMTAPAFHFRRRRARAAFLRGIESKAASFDAGLRSLLQRIGPGRMGIAACCSVLSIFLAQLWRS